MSPEPRIVVQIPCERCGASGREQLEPVAGGASYLGDGTRRCRECDGRGYIDTAVGLTELKRALDQIPPG